MSAAILPRLPAQPAHVVSAAPNLGWYVMVNGTRWRWEGLEAVAHGEAKYINKLVRDTVLDCASVAVQVAADWATEHSLTVHPEAVAVCEDVANAIRAKLMEKIGQEREWAERNNRE